MCKRLEGVEAKYEGIGVELSQLEVGRKARPGRRARRVPVSSNCRTQQLNRSGTHVGPDTMVKVRF
jgi:hypothetical protein